MSDIEYSVITSDVIKSFDFIKMSTKITFPCPFTFLLLTEGHYPHFGVGEVQCLSSIYFYRCWKEDQSLDLECQKNGLQRKHCSENSIGSS